MKTIRATGYTVLPLGWSVENRRGVCALVHDAAPLSLVRPFPPGELWLWVLFVVDLNGFYEDA